MSISPMKKSVGKKLLFVIAFSLEFGMQGFYMVDVDCFSEVATVDIYCPIAVYSGDCEWTFVYVFIFGWL